MQRVLAVLGALLLVVVAVLVRSLLDGGDDSRGRGGGGDGPTRLLCAEELADVCAALEDAGVAEVQIEAAGVTLDRLGAPDAGLDADGWLTLDPFPRMVDQRREFATGSALFGAARTLDASTGLALAADADRAEALASDCGEVGWACLGDAAGQPWADHGGEPTWGSVKPGFDSPATSGSGLLVLAQAMADHLQKDDFALQDLDRRWLRDLEEAVPTRTTGSALRTLLQQGPGAFAAVGALGKDAEAATRTAQGEGLSIFYPAPMFRADVVLAPLRGTELDDLADADELARALADAGWEEGGGGAALPTAGALDALRSAWEDVA